MKRILLASAILGLSACTTLPDLFGGGADTATNSAYKEEKVSANRYKVTYTAPEKATKAQIADRTLARAAQLTLDNGNEWFEVASKIDIENGQTLVILMGSGETLAGGSSRIYDAKETVGRLKNKIS
ncbi:MAG TPA: hypothetical protein VFV70_11365 [Hyphomonadaceae bacterium]|nr:hypothetical protein [Hyphomonadaceae bacterium]